MNEYCEKCERLTEKGICVVHGRVDTFTDGRRDRVRKTVEEMIYKNNSEHPEEVECYTRKIMKSVEFSEEERYMLLSGLYALEVMDQKNEMPLPIGNLIEIDMMKERLT